jgi:hypothetical protein
MYTMETLVIAAILAIAVWIGYTYGPVAGVCAVPGLSFLFVLYGFNNFGNKPLKDGRVNKKNKNATSSNRIVEPSLE